MPWCKSCHKARNRAYDLANADKVRAKKREWERTHPEGKKRWRANNPDKVKAYQAKSRQRPEARAYHTEYMKKDYAANPEKRREVARRWIAAHPEYNRMRSKLRKARKKNAGGTITVAEWQALKEQYDFRCLACQRQEPEINLTLDHILALTKGGTHTIDNVQPLCLPCNSKKQTRYIDYRPSIQAPNI